MHVHSLWPILLMVTYFGNDEVLACSCGQPPDCSRTSCYYATHYCNDSCSCNYDYSTSQNTGLSECRDPTYDICFIPLSNACQYTAYPLTIKQGAYDTALFVSTVETTPLTRSWDGLCLTHIKLTSTLYIQIRTVTYTDGSYDFFTFLIADEVDSPGSGVASRNTQDAKSLIEYFTTIGNTTISKYSFRGLYSIPTYGSCYDVHFDPNYVVLTTKYPTLIPTVVRSKAASQLLGNVPNKQTLAYKNTAYCIKSLNGISVLNPQTTSPATGVSSRKC